MSRKRATAALEGYPATTQMGPDVDGPSINPIHLLLTDPTQLQMAVKTVWEETQARMHAERIEREMG